MGNVKWFVLFVKMVVGLIICFAIIGAYMIYKLPSTLPI